MKDLFRQLQTFFAGPQFKYNPLPGVQYFFGSWQELLTEAQRQRRPVFVDFHSIGFYPREQLIREAYADSSLAVTFNANFVNYQVDALRGEGLAIAERYRIAAYPVPTSLFVLSDGTLLHRASGYEGVKGLLAEADKALTLAQEPNQLSLLERDYVAGKRDPAFLAAYLRERGRVNMPNHDALTAYLSLVPWEPDWTTDEVVELITGNLTTYDPRLVEALLNRLPQLSSSPDRSSASLATKIRKQISGLIRTRFHRVIADRDEQRLAEVIADNESFLRAERGDKLSDQEVDAMTNGYRRRFYADTKNLDKFRPLAEAEAWRLMTISMESVREKDRLAYQRFRERKKKLDARGERPDYWKWAKAMSTFESHDIASKLNHLVSYYCENMTDPDDLEQALTWSARMLDYDRSPNYVNLHARLLVKLGRLGEANEVLRNANDDSAPGAGQTSGVYYGYVSIKPPEDYEW